MLKLFILLLVLPAYAELYRSDDPHYIDLVPSTFNDSANCNSVLDQSNLLKCKTHTEHCEYVSEVFTTVTPLKVKKLIAREHLFAQVEGFEYVERGFGIRDTVEFKTISLPNNFKLYSISSKTQGRLSWENFISVWDFPEESKDQIILSPKSEFQPVSFELSELKLETRTPIYLFGQTVGDVKKDEPLVLNFSPGTYKLVFTFGQSHKKSVVTITITDQKESNSRSVVLKDNGNPKLLGFHNLTGMVNSPRDKSSITRFFESKHIAVVQGNRKIDVSNLFQSSPDTFLRTEGEEFSPKLVQSPAKLDIKGTCKVSEFRPRPVSYPIFSDSRKNVKKGDLIASFDDGVSYHYQEGDNKSEFIPNLSNGFCTNSEGYLGVHRVVASENKLSDLGEGPWGKNGWVESESHELFNSNFIFFVPNLGPVRIRPSEKENNFNFDYFDREGVVEEVRELKRESLVGPDGKLMVNIDCDSGC